MDCHFFGNIEPRPHTHFLPTAFHNSLIWMMRAEVVRYRRLRALHGCGGQVRVGHLPDASSFGCVSFMVGYFPIFSPFCKLLLASGVGMVRYFLTLNEHFRKNKNVLDKSPSCNILQIFCGMCPQGIHTFVWLLVSQLGFSPIMVVW